MTVRLILTDEEVLALDDYFTRRVGYIGHEDRTDETAHELANVVGRRAKEIRESADNSDR